MGRRIPFVFGALAALSMVAACFSGTLRWEATDDTPVLPATLDTTFGVNGRFVLAGEAGNTAEILVMRPYPPASTHAGKILAGGYTILTGVKTMTVMRIDEDGTPDTSFNTAGPIQGQRSYTNGGPCSVVDLAILPSDDYYVLGACESAPPRQLAIFLGTANASGASGVVGTFNVGSILNRNILTFDTVPGALVADGVGSAVIAAGALDEPSFSAILPTGVSDTTYFSTGETQFSASAPPLAEALLLSGTNIIYAGTVASGIELREITTAGAPSSVSVATVTVTQSLSLAGLGRLSTGFLVVAGTRTQSNVTTFAWKKYSGGFVEEVSLNGGLGYGEAAFTENAVGEDLFVGSDDNLYVAGHTTEQGRSVFAVARFRPTGELAPSGKMTVAFDDDAQAKTLFVDSNGRIVVGGWSLNAGVRAFSVVRISP